MVNQKLDDITEQIQELRQRDNALASRIRSITVSHNEPLRTQSSPIYRTK